MNLVLQHWTGELDELGYQSSENIAQYAEEFGADYLLLRGQVFRENLLPYCQKVYMLDESFDEYETVVMLDMDMFAPAECRHDIFKETGIGVAHPSILRRLMRRTEIAHMLSAKHPFWGGAIYRMDQPTRAAMRAGIDEDELAAFGRDIGMSVDESIMHRLAVLANIPKTESVFLDRQWALSSFLEPSAETGFIHIRKRLAGGGKGEKIRVHRRLVAEGVLGL